MESDKVGIVVNAGAGAVSLVTTLMISRRRS